MGKTLAILLFTWCFVITNANAQKIRFTDSTNVWNVVRVFVGDNTPEFSYYAQSYAGDTVVDSQHYKRLAGYYVREDTLAGKIFINLSDTEEVLFNYNWRVGDTISYHFPSLSSYNCYVNSFDSTLINNVWHHVWGLMPLSGDYDPGYVIEGIGSISGPLYLLNPIHFESYIELYCFSNQGTTPAVSPIVEWFDNTTSCTLNVDQVINQRQQAIIYPNPVKTTLYIASSSDVNQIVVDNLLGQQMYSRVCNSKQVHIDVGNLPDGIYFIKINGVDVQKFIKQ